MKKALLPVLAVALAGVFAGSATAQVPNIQVYFDANHTQTQTTCGQPGSVSTVYVVMNNWNMNVVGVDFSIDYGSALTWVADVLPDPSTSASIGQSPTGIAIAYANCCFQDGFLNNEVLRAFVVWGQCDCAAGPKPVVVGGYTGLNKTRPSAVRYEDFVEFPGVGMTSLICPGAVSTQASTWGQVKALYR